MTKPADEEALSDEKPLSDEEKRTAKVFAEGSYQALKRLRDEDEQDAQQIGYFPEEEPKPQQPAVILYYERLHWVALIDGLSGISFVLIVLGSFIGMAVLQIYLRENIDKTVLAPLAGLVKYVFPWGAAVLCVVTIVYRIKLYGITNIRDLILWFSSTWTITTYEVKHKIEVKGVFLNFATGIEDTTVTIPRSEIINPSVTQNWVSELLHYGEVTLSSAAEHDDRFRSIRYMRRPDRIKEILGLN